MFIKTSVFKALIKQAYKQSGLVVGSDGESIFVAGAYWVLQMQEKHIPNKIKAAVIELTGDLPGAGEIFRAKAGEGNQYELQYYEDYNVRKAAEAASVELTVTKCGYYAERGMRVLQNRQNGHLFMVGEEVIKLITIADLEERESKPSGPLLLQNQQRVFWLNEAGAFCACLISVEHSEKTKAYLEALRVVELEDWRE